MKDKRELARVWAEDKPRVHIGKGGVDESVVAEIRRQLKRQRLIKVRILPSAMAATPLDDLVTNLVTQTGATAYGRRGFVVVLGRKGL
jgi:RNA-binding protein